MPRLARNLTTRRQVKQALLERLSLRGIERIFGVSRLTVADWLATWSQHLPPLADTLSEACWDDVLELDELWSFVLKKAHKRWIWVALCRRVQSQRVMGRIMGKPFRLLLPLLTDEFVRS